MSFAKFYWALLIVTCLTITMSSSSTFATDWYWASGFDGWWDDANEYYNPWQDSSGNSPTTVDGAPGVGDSAYLVIPYMGSFCDGTGYCYIQPVSVYYQSTESPPLNNIAIEGGNVLYQWYGLGSDPADLNLTSNAEYIGGTPFSYDDLPPYTYIDPSVGIYPQGEHIQNAGTNIVNDRLEIGGSEGSYGRYFLDNASDSIYGTLTAESLEIIGSAGEGLFEQHGGVHEVGTALIMGMSATGSGTYQMTDGTLDATVEIFGSSGYGEFNQSGGENSVNNLVIGQNPGGVGVYNLSGSGILSVGTEKIGQEGLGSFFQTNGTHNVGTLLLGTETGGSGTYNLGAGVLTVDNLMTVGDNAVGTFIQDGGTVNIGTVADPGELNIGSAGATGQYTLNNGLLNVVGVSKLWEGSSFTQTGGEHGAVLFTNSNGAIYNMEGGTFNLGQWNAEGNVIQTGGQVTVGVNLIVGATGQLGSTSNEYLLEDTGDGAAPKLKVYGTGTIGDLNEAQFTQRGPESYAEFNNLIIGGGFIKGDYVLEEGTLHVNGQESIGHTSDGYLSQSGGRNEIDGELIIGDVGNGYYHLTAGELDVDGNMYIRKGSVFNQSSSNYVGQDLIFGGGTGKETLYQLSDFGLLWVHGNETIGVYELGHNAFEHLGGVHAVDHNLTIDNNSIYHHSGGTLMVGGDLTMNYGTAYNLHNNAQVSVNGSAAIQELNQQGGNINVTGNAVFIGGNQQTGDNIVLGDAAIYGYSFENGSFLVNGELRSSFTMNGGLLEAALHTVVGHFDQFGGEHIVNGATVVAASGNAFIGGISLFNSESLTNLGSLRFAEDSEISISGAFENSGSLSFEGTNSPDIGDITNYGELTITGASPKTIYGGLYNEVSGNVYVINTDVEFNNYVKNEVGTLNGSMFSISDSQVDFQSFYNSGYQVQDVFQTSTVRSELSIEDSTVTFHSGLTNWGTVRITNSVVDRGDYHGGPFSRLITDPSDLYFSNVEIEGEGIIQAGVGDRFFVEGDFINNSVNNTEWNTTAAGLIFNGVGIQNFYLAGIDLGATAAGYENNFAWGELILGSGVNLNLLDGNDVAGAALYIGLLGFEDPVVDLYDLIFGSLMSDFNVYYNSSLAGNNFLGGMSYALGGSGYLLPAFFDTPPTEPIPEPSTFILVGCGLVGLIFIVRRNRKERLS